MIKANNQSGFTAVELLITLFVAVAFLVGGYQLYSLVIKDSGQTRSQSRAANIAYNYLRQYAANITNPCTPYNTPVTLSPTVTGLTAVTATINITCPYAASSGSNNATSISQITATITYNSPQQTVQYSTFTKGNVAGQVTSGLTGWWKLNGDATDTASGRTGTIVGATPTTGQNGVPNSAYSFDGNDYITLLNASATAGNNPYTLSAWIKTPSIGDYTIIGWGSNTATNDSNVLRTYTGTTTIINTWNGNYLGYNDTSIGSNAWKFVTATYDGTKRTLYVNGTQVAQDSPSGLNPAAGWAAIGKQGSTGAYYFVGSIDDARIYNRGLTSNEVQTLYVAGAQ